MSFTVIKKISTEQILDAMPVSEAILQNIAQDRREIQAIIEGHDPRLLLVVGPCSAWPNQAVLEYAERLVNLKQKYQDQFKIVMRVYIQKPRTTKGWTGPVNQPNPFANPDIESGIRYSRQMMLEVLNMGLPIADEALFTHNAKGFMELLSWVAIGARSSEDQEHRIFASAVDCAVGLKNPTHGALDIAVNSVIAAQHSHVALIDGDEVHTDGNPFAHVVLRGSKSAPNYSNVDLEKVLHLMQHHHVKNPSVIIDVSHDNCLINGKKDPKLQPLIIYDVLKNIQNKPELKKLVKGFMIESFLKEGHQKIEELSLDKVDLTGLSITDPCLSWEQTEVMLQEMAGMLK